MAAYPVGISLRPGNPDFLDLPWNEPLRSWGNLCTRLEDAPRGVSRHPVQFVNYDGVLYALKETSVSAAEREYGVLHQVEELNQPAVIPVGHVQTETSQGKAGVLITRFLENSLPYRVLFMSSGLETYRQHLLDAIVGLLVQLHLSGIYWGDCSLSNTLFRRDAGALRAYLVDAETAEFHSGYFQPTLRFHDLQIMEDNVNGEIMELFTAGLLTGLDPNIPPADTGAYVRLRYQQLWEEITREDIINPDEHYRIQERVRVLNNLGYSVGNIELEGTDDGNRLRLRVVVTDRNFHRDQLFNLTGIDAEENQAQVMMNEIQELRATLSQAGDHKAPLGVAGYYWLENVYKPVVDSLGQMVSDHSTPTEIYCQILEHKWYLSEQAQHDVGHQMAAEDFIVRFGSRESYGESKQDR